MLIEFDKRVREVFDAFNIDYARVFSRTSNVFCQNYDLYVKRNQFLLAHFLVEKVKEEVDYNNPKWYRKIVFSEEALNLLKELFPERKIETDYDALKLLEDLVNDAFAKLTKGSNKEVENGRE